MEGWYNTREWLPVHPFCQREGLDERGGDCTMVVTQRSGEAETTT